MTTELHAVITGDPEYVALQVRRTQLADARTANAAAVADAEAKHADAIERWREIARMGGDPGARPEPTGIIDPEVRQAFAAASQRELAAIRDAERQLIEDKADDYLAALGDTERQALHDAAKLVAGLDAIADRLGPVVEAVRIVRRAVGDPTEAAPHVSAETLVNVCRSGGSLLQPPPETTVVVSGSMSYTKQPSTTTPPVLETDDRDFQKAGLRKAASARRQKGSLPGRR